MEKTYLIQRLRKPRGFFNPFSFGAGGLKDGGLSKEATNTLKNIWTFDYMGAAEFEWGTVPTSLKNIAHYVKDASSRTGKISLKKDVYYLCEAGVEKEVKKTIEQLAKDKLDLHEPSFFKESLQGEEHFEEYVGWLELNNHFLFFTDKEMYDRTLKLFGVQ